MTDTTQQLGISGTIHGYDVVVIGDQITVTWDGTLVAQRQVADLGPSSARRASSGSAGDGSRMAPRCSTSMTRRTATSATRSI